jgi:hypothetical protein
METPSQEADLIVGNRDSPFNASLSADHVEKVCQHIGMFFDTKYAPVFYPMERK